MGNVCHFASKYILKMTSQTEICYRLATTGFLALLCYIIIEIYPYLALLLIGYFGYKYLRRFGETRIDIKGQGILVTGCDTGMTFPVVT